MTTPHPVIPDCRDEQDDRETIQIETHGSRTRLAVEAGKAKAFTGMTQNSMDPRLRGDDRRGAGMTNGVVDM